MEGIQIVIGVIIALVISGLAVAYSMGAFSSSTTGQVNLLAPSVTTVKDSSGNYYVKIDFRVQSTYKTPIKFSDIKIDGTSITSILDTAGDGALIAGGTTYDAPVTATNITSVEVAPGSQMQITLKIKYGLSGTSAEQHVIEIAYQDMNNNDLGTATIEYVVS